MKDLTLKRVEFEPTVIDEISDRLDNWKAKGNTCIGFSPLDVDYLLMALNAVLDLCNKEDNANHGLHLMEKIFALSEIHRPFKQLEYHD